MENNEFFRVSSSGYVQGTEYRITRPASLSHPKDHAVMFIMEEYPERREVFNSVTECLIFWPESWDVPPEISSKNAVVPCENPHLEFCKFFAKHNITGLCMPEETVVLNGSYVVKTAKIGDGTIIFPGCYIGGSASIGKNCFIGSGVKILGRVQIGNGVQIRENTVIGAEGLTTDRDESGHPVPMPQFGGVVIGDNVYIGANSVIARGAIDDTILGNYAKIDNMVFVSHNVNIGEESFIVGQSILFGSATIGKQAQISGGCTVGNYVHIGDHSLLGMGSVANKSIPDNTLAYGNTVKPIRKRFEE